MCHLPIVDQGNKDSRASARAHPGETCSVGARQLERSAWRVAESRVTGRHAHFPVHL